MFRIICAIFLFTLASAAAHAEPSAQSHWIERKPPAAALPVAFTDPAGQSHNLQEFKGRWVLFNIWAVWCAPCLREMPSLDALQKTMGSDKFKIVTLAIDQDGPHEVPAYFKKLNVTALTPFFDAGVRLPRSLIAHGLPTTLLLNPRGEEVGRMMGAIDWMAQDNRDWLAAKMVP